MKKTKLLFVLVFIVFGFLAVGCASYPAKQDWEYLNSESPLKNNKVFSLEIISAPDVKVPVEALNGFKKIMIEEMAKKNIAVVQPDQDVPLITVEIVKYHERNFITFLLLGPWLGGEINIETKILVVNKNVVILKGTLGARTSPNPFNFSSAYGTVEGVQRKIAKQLAEKLSKL
ncbi:MAG: hypothetical protein HYW71_01795 [Candidatus Niyogibacteria bacterium]|nr:hypothetical protein [Candidatus Niyogibacteria bacterium]